MSHFESWFKKVRRSLLAVGLVCVLALSDAPVASAASSGPNSGGTFADDSTVGTVVWSSTSNAQSSNNSYAQANLSNTNTTSHYLKATNFGFAIPTTATINGVLVEVERSYSLLTAGAVISDLGAYLVKGGTIAGENLSDGSSFSSSDAYASFGGATNLWGLELTPADINAFDFGVVYSAQIQQGEAGATFSGRARVDHIRITVYYTEAASSGQAPIRRYAVAVFNGYAYPQSTYLMYENGIPIKRDTVMQYDGSFQTFFETLEGRYAEFTFVFTDKEGRSAPPQFVRLRLDTFQPVSWDISPPPTIELQKAAITRGEPLFVTGYASPRGVVDVIIDDRTIGTVPVSADGIYTAIVNTATHNIPIGAHSVVTKQRFNAKAGESGNSTAKRFIVSAFGTVRGDFNEDGAVNISDWSIFLARRNDPAMLEKLDLSGDGKINAIDLSIFLRLVVIR